MDISEVITFTTPTCPPRSQRKLYTTQKSIATLPNFLSHVQVKDVIFTASLKGEILCFQPELPRKPTVIGKHDGGIHCLIYHSMWNLLISASVDGTIKIWDAFQEYARPKASNDFCLQTIQAHAHAVTQLVVHGDIFLSGSVDKTVKAWKVDVERVRFGLNPWFSQLGKTFNLNAWVASMWASHIPLVSATGDILVGDNSGRLTILKSHTQVNEPTNVIGIRLVKSKQKLKKHGIIGIMMIVTHNLLIISSTNGQIRISDIQGNMRFCTLDNDRVSNFIDMTWNAEREELILLDSSGTLQIYDYRMDRVVLTQYMQPDAKCISFNPLAQEVLVSGRYGCQLWKLARNVPCKEYCGHEAPVAGIYVNMTIEGENILMKEGEEGYDGTGESVYDDETEKPFEQNDADSASEYSSSVSGSVLTGRSSYYGGTESTTSEYTTTTTTTHQQHNSHHLHSKMIITTGQDSKVCIWSSDRFQMKVVDSFKETTGEIYSSEYLSSMKMLVTGHNTGEIAFTAITRLHLNEPKIYLKGHKSTVSCVKYVEFEKDKGPEECSKYIVTGGFDGKIGMCNITNYERLNRTPFYEMIKQCYSCTIICIIGNSMNDTFISGASDGVIKIWNKELVLESTLGGDGTAGGHKQGVTALVMDGYFLFSSCEDSEIIMWDTLSGVNLKSFTHHTAGVNHMTMLPHSGEVISADRNGHLCVWNYSTSEIVFEYSRKKTDLSYILYDGQDDDVYVGTHEGCILKINLHTGEDSLEGGPGEGRSGKPHLPKLDSMQSLDRRSIAQNSMNSMDGGFKRLNSPTDTPRLHIRGAEESQSFAQHKDPILEEKLKSRLTSHDFAAGEDDLDDIFR